jgi:hypothetical protein
MADKTPTQAAEELTSKLESLFSADCPLGLGVLLDRVEVDVSAVDKAALQRLVEAAWGVCQFLDQVATDLSAAG